MPVMPHIRVPKKEKKMADAPTKQREEQRGRLTPEGERIRKREATQTATGAGILQERAASEGDYAGLGLADRAAAERMVRSGEAKNRGEAAAMIKKKRQPKPTAEQQAGALEK